MQSAYCFKGNTAINKHQTQHADELQCNAPVMHLRKRSAAQL